MKPVNSILAVAALASGMVYAAAAPAAATCAVYPGTNEITIRIGDGPGLMKIPATPSGVVGLCVDVIGDPSPSFDPDVTAEFPTGCGTPCFVLAWDGVSTEPVTVRVTVIVDNEPKTIEHVIGGQGQGSFCINAGTPCP